jgi:hypothetical protein
MPLYISSRKQEIVSIFKTVLRHSFFPTRIGGRERERDSRVGGDFWQNVEAHMSLVARTLTTTHTHTAVYSGKKPKLTVQACVDKGATFA